MQQPISAVRRWLHHTRRRTGSITYSRPYLTLPHGRPHKPIDPSTFSFAQQERDGMAEEEADRRTLDGMLRTSFNQELKNLGARKSVRDNRLAAQLDRALADTTKRTLPERNIGSAAGARNTVPGWNADVEAEPVADFKLPDVRPPPKPEREFTTEEQALHKLFAQLRPKVWALAKGNTVAGAKQAQILELLRQSGLGRDALRKLAVVKHSEARRHTNKSEWVTSRNLLRMAWNNGGEGCDERSGYLLATRRVHDKGFNSPVAHIGRDMPKADSDAILQELVRRGNPLGHDGIALMALVDYHAKHSKMVQARKQFRTIAHKHLIAAGDAGTTEWWEQLALIFIASKEVKDRQEAVKIWDMIVQRKGVHHNLYLRLATLYSPHLEVKRRPVESDLEKSLRYLRLGAPHDAECAHMLALHYYCPSDVHPEDHFKQWGVQPDDEIAASTFKYHADVRGYAPSIALLGEMLIEGRALSLQGSMNRKEQLESAQHLLWLATRGKKSHKEIPPNSKIWRVAHLMPRLNMPPMDRNRPPATAIFQDRPGWR